METLYGYIKSFNYQTVQGRIALNTLNIRFCGTTWDSGHHKRAPRKGERVAVVFNDEGQLLSVRALPA